MRLINIVLGFAKKMHKMVNLSINWLRNIDSNVATLTDFCFPTLKMATGRLVIRQRKKSSVFFYLNNNPAVTMLDVFVEGCPLLFTMFTMSRPVRRGKTGSLSPLVIVTWKI